MGYGLWVVIREKGVSPLSGAKEAKDARGFVIDEGSITENTEEAQRTQSTILSALCVSSVFSAILP